MHSPALGTCTLVVTALEARTHISALGTCTLVVTALEARTHSSALGTCILVTALGTCMLVTTLKGGIYTGHYIEGGMYCGVCARGLYCGVYARGPVLWGLCLSCLCCVYPIIGPLFPIMGYTSTDGPLNM